MIVYKLFKIKDNKLYPLYVEANREMEIGRWLKAQIGELADETHVKASGCGGRLSLRPGFHSTTVPFTDWIGKKMYDGTLAQRRDTVWCECEIRGNEVTIEDRNGSRTLVDGYYRFRTNVKQKDPWLISSEILIKRILGRDEVKRLCTEKGMKAQPHEDDYMENPLFDYLKSGAA